MQANETSDGFKAVNLAAVTDGRAADFLKRLSTMSADIKEASLVHGCLSGGYAPNGYELADFSIIRKNGLFHLFHIPQNCRQLLRASLQRTLVRTCRLPRSGYLGNP